MALIIKNLPRSGEQHSSVFSQCLTDKLPQNVIIWEETPIGENGFIPDYFMVHPQHGVLVFVEKDWSLEDLNNASQSLGALRKPILLAKTFAMTVKAHFGMDPILSTWDDGETLPVKAVVVLPNMHSHAVTQSWLDDFDGSAKILFKEDCAPEISSQRFTKTLDDFFGSVLRNKLTTDLLDRIRWYCFPSLRISEEISAQDGTINVLDLKKERYLRGSGSSSQYIHGVSGSGKTTMILHQCQKLTQSRDKTALVLSYSNVLAADIAYKISMLGLNDRVQSMCLKDWCLDLADRLHLDLDHRMRRSKAEFLDRTITQLRGRLPDSSFLPFAFDAVYVDEAHDFKAEWLTFIELATGEAPQHYYYDSTQGGRFQAQSNHTDSLTLNRNYRNSSQIIDLARDFAEDEKIQSTLTNTSVLDIQNNDKSGDVPELIRLASVHAELDYVFEKLQEYHNGGVPWGNMAIIYRSKGIGKMIASSLPSIGFSADFWQSGEKTYHPQSDTVKVLPLEQAKGLEFDVVIMPGLGKVEGNGSTYIEDLQLMYMGMTRACQHLVMTYHRHTPFVSRLKTLLDDLRLRSAI